MRPGDLSSLEKTALKWPNRATPGAIKNLKETQGLIKKKVFWGKPQAVSVARQELKDIVARMMGKYK